MDIIKLIPPATLIYEPGINQADNPRMIGAGVDIGALESDALFVDGLSDQQHRF